MAGAAHQNTQLTPFLKFIAYLQILGCILVVFGHSFHEYPDGVFGHTLPAYQLMHSFRMALFTFVSGFLMIFTMRIKHTPRTLREFTVTKLNRLIIPFVVLNLVTFVPRALLSSLADDEIGLTFSNLIYCLIEPERMVVTTLWFIQMSFILLIFCYALLRLASWMGVRDWWVYVFCVVLFLTLPALPVYYPSAFSVNMVVRLGLYFVLGMVYARYMPQTDAVVPWAKARFFVLMVCGWLVCFHFQENDVVYVLTKIFGIMMCISLCKILEARNWNILDPLIGSTYLIFLLSWFFNVATQNVLHHFVVLPWWIYTLLSLATGVLIPWLMYVYMEHHPKSLLTRGSMKLLGQTFKHKGYKSASSAKR